VTGPDWPPPAAAAATTSSSLTRRELQPRRHRLLRQRPPDDIGAFDTPKHAGMPLGEVLRVGPTTSSCSHDPRPVLNNGDGLTWWDLQGELQGVPVNVARQLDAADPLRWRIVAQRGHGWRLKDLRPAPPSAATATWPGTACWQAVGRAPHRVDLRLDETDSGLLLTITR
jgi:hypothetical protein